MTFRPALTDEQEKKLVVDHEDGFTMPQLAERYQISLRTVNRVLARQLVKHKFRTKKHRKKAKRNPIVLQPCGTNAAYYRHKRHGEYPCIPCLEAHATYQKESVSCS